MLRSGVIRSIRQVECGIRLPVHQRWAIRLQQHRTSRICCRRKAFRQTGYKPFSETEHASNGNE